MSPTPTAYAVICPSHGKVYLTLGEYCRQLDASDSLWECPCCDRVSEWDDDNYEAFAETESGE